jgi:hypothetical protein
MSTRKLLAPIVLSAAVLSSPAHALSAGDLAFTSFNADEDGWSMVTFVDLAANTVVYFGDNEWNGSAIGAAGAFNTGESYSSWNSGPSLIAAGTVIRFSSVDSATLLAASAGNFSLVTVSGSANRGIANSNETIYAYEGSSATTPTAFITAITNGDFAVDGTLAGTGLTAGVNAIRLNTNFPTATPDFGEYTGLRSGQASFADYKPLVANVANWTVDTTNGTYTTTVPNTAAFTITPVPEPGALAMMLAGFGILARCRRRTA